MQITIWASFHSFSGKTETIKEMENIFKEIHNEVNEIKDEEEKTNSWIKDLVKEVPEVPIISSKDLATPTKHVHEHESVGSRHHKDYIKSRHSKKDESIEEQEDTKVNSDEDGSDDDRRHSSKYDKRHKHKQDDRHQGHHRHH